MQNNLSRDVCFHSFIRNTKALDTNKCCVCSDVMLEHAFHSYSPDYYLRFSFSFSLSSCLSYACSVTVDVDLSTRRVFNNLSETMAFHSWHYLIYFFLISLEFFSMNMQLETTRQTDNSNTRKLIVIEAMYLCCSCGVRYWKLQCIYAFTLSTSIIFVFSSAIYEYRVHNGRKQTQSLIKTHTLRIHSQNTEIIHWNVK